LSFVIFTLILIYISICDLKNLSIGVKELLTLSVFTIFNVLFKIHISGFNFIFDPLKGALLSIIFFTVLILLTKGRGIGVGDLFFFTIACLNIGFINSIEAISISFIAGSIYSIVLILLKRANLKDRIAFIPFLCIGIIVSLFINYY
jgi:prepilin signal peptidase PulO-like enzyme (type II secretory pathway)